MDSQPTSRAADWKAKAAAKRAAQEASLNKRALDDTAVASTAPTAPPLQATEPTAPPPPSAAAPPSATAAPIPSAPPAYQPTPTVAAPVYGPAPAATAAATASTPAVSIPVATTSTATPSGAAAATASTSVPKQFLVTDEVTLILGETGAGKSTMINYLANYMLQGTPTAPWVAISTKYRDVNIPGFPAKSANERNSNDPKQSQTLHPLQYMAGSLPVVDTPGLADTRGIQQDYENVRVILEYVAHFPRVRCVMLVIRGTTARVTGPAKIVTRMLCGMLPQSVLRTLVIVFTHCASEAELNFDLDSFCQQLGVNARSVPIFYMQNSCFNSKQPQSQASWDDSMQTIGEIVSTVERMKPVPSSDFLIVLEARRNLQISMGRLERLGTYGSSAAVQSDMKQEKEAMRGYCKQLRSACPRFDIKAELELQLDHYDHERTNARTPEDRTKYDTLFSELRPVVLEFAPELEAKFWPPQPEIEVSPLLVGDNYGSMSDMSSGRGSRTSSTRSVAPKLKSSKLGKAIVLLTWLWFVGLSLATIAGAFVLDNWNTTRTHGSISHSDTLSGALVSVAASVGIVAGLAVSISRMRGRNCCLHTLALCLFAAWTLGLITATAFVVPEIYQHSPLSTESRLYLSLAPVVLMGLMSGPLLGLRSASTIKDMIIGTALVFVLVLLVLIFAAIYVLLDKYASFSNDNMPLFIAGASVVAFVVLLVLVVIIRAIATSSGLKKSWKRVLVYSLACIFLVLLGLSSTAALIYLVDVAVYYAAPTGAVLALVTAPFLIMRIRTNGERKKKRRVWSTGLFTIALIVLITVTFAIGLAADSGAYDFYILLPVVIVGVVALVIFYYWKSKWIACLLGIILVAGSIGWAAWSLVTMYDLTWLGDPIAFALLVGIWALTTSYLLALRFCIKKRACTRKRIIIAIVIALIASLGPIAYNIFA